MPKPYTSVFCLAAVLVSACGPSAEEVARAKAVQELAIAEAREAERKMKYQACVSEVVDAHNAKWTDYCSKVAVREQTQLRDCLSNPEIITNPYMGERFCKDRFANIDPTPSCSLPPSLAVPLEKHTQEEKARCLEKARMDLL